MKRSPFRRRRAPLRLLRGVVVFVLAIAAWATPSSPSATFSPPVEDPTLVEPGWAARPVRHTPAHAAADLVVTLDQQLYPAAVPALAQLAAARGVRIDVERGTCGVSAGALFRKEAEIAGFCCPPGPDDRLPGVRYRTLGVAAIAVIVHPDNPVRELTLADARALFEGRIRRWSDLSGGAGFARPVVPVVRLHCKRRPGHWHLLLDNEDLFSPRAVEVGAIEDMVAQVGRRPGAVGWETAWMARHRAPAGRPVRMVRVDGVDPLDTEALAAGRYPLYRTFTLATWAADDNPLVVAAVAAVERAFTATADTFVAVGSATLVRHGWRFAGGELQGALAR